MKPDSRRGKLRECWVLKDMKKEKSQKTRLKSSENSGILTNIATTQILIGTTAEDSSSLKSSYDENPDLTEIRAFLK